MFGLPFNFSMVKGDVIRAYMLRMMATYISNIRPGTPGITVDYRDGGIYIGIMPDNIVDDMSFPFHLFTDDDGDVGVEGGTVFTGNSKITVGDFTPVSVSEDDIFILTVSYYHDGVISDTAVISKVSTAPTDWLTYTATDDPADGESHHIIELGNITADGIVQQHWGDVVLRKGKTWQEYVGLSAAYASNDFDLTRRQILWVNGIMETIGSESDQTVFTTADCPE